MRIVSFSVRNFRSISKTAKLRFHDGITTLIGPNNEGKSNILLALVAALDVASRLHHYTLLRGGRLYAPHLGDRVYRWAADFPVALQATVPRGRSEFDLEFELTTSEVAAFRSEIQSSLNGTLPIRIELGQEEPKFAVRKRGPGGKALSAKASKIARFIGNRIDLLYIPAIRPASAATSVIEQMVAMQLSSLQQNAEYKAAMARVEELQQPLLRTIGKSISETLKVFLPDVRDVNVAIPSEQRYRNLARSVEVTIDDGTPTSLSRKGDGVQSLAALGMMRHAAQQQGQAKRLVLAIEEPESHLHPHAIHELKKVLDDLANQHQVIITTHCPLFVERREIAANILVADNVAEPARDVRHIRDIMGIRVSDNLVSAEVLLMVEGDQDRTAVRSLLSHHSIRLRKALSSGVLAIDVLGGGSNLSYKLTLAREAMCIAHSLIDNDLAGREAVKRAMESGILAIVDLTHTNCPGMAQSELEDFYDAQLIAQSIATEYGVIATDRLFTGTNKKWTDRMRELFQNSGKPWDDSVAMNLKWLVAREVARSPGKALHASRRAVFDALVGALERKLGYTPTDGEVLNSSSGT